MTHIPRTDDIGFILHDVLQASAQLQALARYGEVDADLMRQVLEEAGRFAADRLAPLRRTGDEVGCHLEDGKVRTPPGSRQAYQDFWQAGWPALSCAPEHGGQGLPEVLNQVLYEMLSAANPGWTMAPALLHGAYACLRHHGDAPLQAAYLPRIASGEWLATMCLTESHAGSDLGLVRTRASARDDGSYAVEGTKIFISGGEHDLSDNIVHLVLARLPQAPPGPRGLSLLLVPKRLADGTANAVVCERIEEKMGLHASPTCVMRFDGATGWLIGTPGQGLSAMFVMMNAARLHVALQGVGLLESAWQIANAYAHERRQMRAPAPHRAPGAASGPDLLIAHPAIQRLLDTQRAWIDGGRVLAYQTAIELDLADHHPDALRRERARRWCALITPVLKAALTAQAFHGASDCLQVLGGHGYVREWGIEQVLRDARVAMIYEGTNEIQAIDLLVRKVLGDGGTSLRAWLEDLQSDLAPQCPAAHRLHQLEAATQALVARAAQDGQHAYWVAADYLQAVALALMGWAWARIDATTGAQAPRWRAPSRAQHAWVAPAFDHHLRLLHTGLEANQS